MSEIQRLHIGKRMSQTVVYGDLIWLAGQCGTAEADISQQTREALAKIDRLLAEVNSDKSRLLSTTIWLADMDDYDAMNEIWDAWIPEGTAPARACGESRLGGNGYRVEIICVAARS
jgi:enamine deaminase RidA (YjgF/YER057c/UK114 family)